MDNIWRKERDIIFLSTALLSMPLQILAAQPVCPILHWAPLFNNRNGETTELHVFKIMRQQIRNNQWMHSAD